METESIDFQKAIKDRMTERKLKAEQRRQVDLQRIRDMKSKTGIDPLQQFPKEIWAMLFTELDPEDRANAKEVHPLFRDLLKNGEIRDISLPLVLKMDSLQFNLHHHRLFSRAVNFRYISYLRCISKSTRKAFDRRVEDNLIKRLQDGMEPNPLYSQRYCTNLCFGSASGRELLSRLLSSFGEGVNPAKCFYSKALSVSFSLDDLDPMDDEMVPDHCSQFKNNLTALLEIIGNQIWHFILYVDLLETWPRLFSFPEEYILFQRWTSLMPNLKWLEFDFRLPKHDKYSIGPDLILSYPFPRLLFLERLSQHCSFTGGRMAFDLFGAVIAANPHVKMLDFNNLSDADLERLQSDQVRSLDLANISMNNESCDGLDIKVIEGFVSFDWKLKTIFLELDMEGETLRPVFRFLEKFPTLERVALKYIHSLEIGDTGTYGYLELPNLQSLDLGMEDLMINYKSNLHFFFSLQFLLHCGKLKTLHWHLRGINDMEMRKQLMMQETGKTIDFRAGLRFLYESNVWNIFPYLDAVKVEIGKVSREGVYDWALFCRHEYTRTALLIGGIKKVGQF